MASCELFGLLTILAGPPRIGFTFRERFEQFLKARLVFVAFGALTARLDPFGMLRSQVVVNLLLELGVCVDLAGHGG